MMNITLTPGPRSLGVTLMLADHGTLYVDLPRPIEGMTPEALNAFARLATAKLLREAAQELSAEPDSASSVGASPL